MLFNSIPFLVSFTIVFFLYWFVFKNHKRHQNLLLLLRKEKGINITFFCSPFCSNVEDEDYISQLQDRIPHFKDFSNVFEDDLMFVNCSHLNEKGAYYFTDFLIKELDL